MKSINPLALHAMSYVVLCPQHDPEPPRALETMPTAGALLAGCLQGLETPWDCQKHGV